MSKPKSNKVKILAKNIKPVNDDEEVIIPISEDFVDADESEDSDDLTSTFAKKRALEEADSWDVVSTDEDDEGVVGIKALANDISDEEQLDAVISDYAGIDGLAPEKSNKED